MTLFCIVAPHKVLTGLKDRRELGRDHLTLAHDLVKFPREYSEVFHPLSEDPRRLVILDTSVIELGNAVDVGMIRDAYDICRPSYVVLPDVLLNWSQTIIQCDRALKNWPRVFPRNTPFMIVPQGRSLEEFAACADWFSDREHIEAWGCPRNLVEAIGTRKDALRVLHSLNPNRPIHMMGFSNNIREDIFSAKYSGVPVMSIDSAVPLRVPRAITMFTEAGKRGDWWEMGFCTDMTINNLTKARGWFE